MAAHTSRKSSYDFRLVGVTAAAAPTARSALRSGIVVLAGVLLVAVNLRAAITSLGALLDEVRDGLHLSGAMAGVVTTMPTIAFAVFGALTPWLTRRVAPARLLLAAMVALAFGQVLRIAFGSAAAFLAASALALGGIAVANILLPMLVKQHFPHHAGLVTGAYTMALTAGASAGAAAAVPVASAFGSWQAGLAVASSRAAAEPGRASGRPARGWAGPWRSTLE
jgi:CP family cyanate transporter-like MFS transporter